MKRKMVVEVMAEHHLSQRLACGLIGITRRALHRVPAEDSQSGAAPAAAGAG
jgi:hypothetical protein